MFCQNCGRQLPDDAKFCGSCGANQDEVLPPSNNANATQQQQANVQQAQPQAQVQPSVPASEKVKGEVNRLQGKLDNSNVAFFKGRSVWDVCGMISVALMVLCLFIPIVMYNSTFTANRYISIISMVTSNYSSAPLVMLLASLIPPAFGAFDVLVTKENSTRHIRLIACGAINLILCFAFSGLIGIFGLFMSSTPFIGFYLGVIASLMMIGVGAVGIYESKKGKIAG